MPHVGYLNSLTVSGSWADLSFRISVVPALTGGRGRASTAFDESEATAKASLP